MPEASTESPEMAEFFLGIDKDIKRCFDIATAARKMGLDPEKEVDIKLAKNMAERVEGLIGTVAPNLLGSGMTKRIVELEKKYSPMDWRVALLIAEEIAKEKFCRFEDKNQAMEVGIRAGFAYHTGGIVAAPLEGFIELKIKKRKDGGEYLCPCYAGPIRGAGGTAAAFSLILTDYVGTCMGYGKYDATDDEVNRYKTEIRDYHERVTNLQYFPSEEELDFLARHIPVEISGDPTEKFEVSNYKDIPRIETNRIRGGMALVFAEGLSQKSPKLWKRLQVWGKEFGLDWGFLNEFLELQKKVKAKAKPAEADGKKEKLSPNYTYIKDLVAGRPVLGFPMRSGGFRLRYGRSRLSGLSAAAINPATMVLLDRYIAIGTQLKVERPGKAASMTSCDTINGPVIRLKDGSVKEINSIKDAKRYHPDMEKILYLGDILFNYGDFFENGHMLVPAGYTEEWWVKELEKKSVDLFGTLDCEKLAEHIDIDPEKLELLIRNPTRAKISARAAINISTKLSVPLHPVYTFFWTQIDCEDLRGLIAWLRHLKLVRDNSSITKAILPYSKEFHDNKTALEMIALPHLVVNNEFVVIEKEFAQAFLSSLGYMRDSDIESLLSHVRPEQGVLEIINSLAGFTIRDKAGTFVGARMGRPEKAKMRKMLGSPQVLFPVGEEGGRLRSFQSALELGHIKAEFPLYYCSSCKKQTIYSVCESCGKNTKKQYYCQQCDKVQDEPECKVHGSAKPYMLQNLDIRHYFSKAIVELKERSYPDLIKGVRGTSNRDHIPEHIFKGVLRAKHDVFVNKDGTVRFDMTELPMTHFKPKEIGVSVEKLNSLGYKKDCKGLPLNEPTQVVELKPQDIILPGGQEAMDEQGDRVFVRVAQFIDELLVKHYNQKPYYNVNSKEDLIGHLLIGLAPHISAGTVVRIIGFSETQGLFAHPLFHAAMRRDCDGDEAGAMLLLDGFLNFSRRYLPDTRGAKTMDAPLVLSSKIIPAEVDDMVHGMDVVHEYPLEMFDAANAYKMPWDIRVEQLNKRLNTPGQYEGIGFTHEVTNANSGVKCSAYKSLPSMREKLEGQMKLAERIRAVDESEVARFVIDKHFLKDTKGNLRKFSMQQFRCVKCNEKFRRVPLAGKCTKCGGKIIFTVAEGSVIKYLKPMLSLAEKYNLPVYLKQTLQLLNNRVEEVFGKEKETQEGLGKWFG
ncbi:DNA polymerase II large subunit [Candidatus Woesearchaeota archaeon]|nr:DNA polymerase II large subunit [Candidatus Woesearchaeota archaeon]